MDFPVGGELVGYPFVSDHHEVLSIGLFGLLREVEAAGDYHLSVDNDHLVVGRHVLVVNESRNAAFHKNLGLCVIYLGPAQIQNDLSFHPSLVGIHQSFGDGNGSEPVCLNENRALGPTDFSNDRLSAAAIRGEIDFDRCEKLCGVGGEDEMQTIQTRVPGSPLETAQRPDILISKA